MPVTEGSSRMSAQIRQTLEKNDFQKAESITMGLRRVSGMSYPEVMERVRIACPDLPDAAGRWEELLRHAAG